MCYMLRKEKYLNKYLFKEWTTYSLFDRIVMAVDQMLGVCFHIATYQLLALPSVQWPERDDKDISVNFLNIHFLSFHFQWNQTIKNLFTFY